MRANPDKIALKALIKRRERIIKALARIEKALSGV